MLTRLAAAPAAALAALAVLLAMTAAPAYADTVYCPPQGGPCIVVADTPGGGGSGGSDGTGSGSSGGSRDCGDTPFLGCYKEGLGYYDSETEGGCFWQVASPQPPAGDPAWQGHEPGDGRIYVQACGWPGLVAFLNVWRDTAPPGFGGGPSPAELAARAINLLPIRGPLIHAAPKVNGAGLVGLPVWIWTPATDTTWGPVSRTAAVPGLSVTATAHAAKIVYQMGNGESITCTSPGTPYKESYGRRPSPDCGYDTGYADPSSTVGGRYTVTGTTTWQINWAGGGQSGELTVTRTATATIDIDELQVITS